MVVAGGMESMTNAPYLLTKARGGYRAGHATMYDHMMLDGLEDAYQVGRAMGTFGEDCAAKYGFTREEQDTFAVESVSRAQQAARDVYKRQPTPSARRAWPRSAPRKAAWNCAWSTLRCGRCRSVPRAKCWCAATP